MQSTTQYDLPAPVVSRLSSLSDWSARHIREVFEAKSDVDCLRAIDATFSQKIALTVNGSPMPREAIKQMVLGMRSTSTNGLSVHWQKAVEKARDSRTNRDGLFDGFYIIRGVNKKLPGMSRPADFERHKNVSVEIRSESSDPRTDSRRIVRLDFVAQDILVNRMATL